MKTKSHKTTTPIKTNIIHAPEKQSNHQDLTARLIIAQHSRIDAALNSTTYFADPFASWQRRSNENFNGLLRQYIPKKRTLSTVSDAELRMIQDRLNNRPRKRLGFKTPNEMFMQSLNRVALRV